MNLEFTESVLTYSNVSATYCGCQCPELVPSCQIANREMAIAGPLGTIDWTSNCVKGFSISSCANMAVRKRDHTEEDNAVQFVDISPDKSHPGLSRGDFTLQTSELEEGEDPSFWR